MIENFFKEIKVDKDFFVEAAKHVVEWNHKNKQPDFDQESFLGQINYLREELEEFQEAAKVNDHVEMLDAAADVFVVASFLTYMFFGDKAYDAMNTDVGDVFSEEIFSNFTMLEETITEPQQMAMLSLAIVRQARDTLIRSKYNEKKVVKTVLKSNDSKYPTKKQILSAWETKDIDFALAMECKQIEDNSNGRYKDITAHYNPTYKVYAFRDSNGKVMKPSTFVKPDIESIVNASN